MRHEHDDTDYDGMGNYGRFPPETDEPDTNNSMSDVLLIVLCLCIPAVYMLIR